MTKRSTAAEAEFGEFASAQAGQLFRIAYLMCGNWHEAEDLVQTALAKLFVAWGRASRADNVGSYARSVLVNSYLSSRRLRRHGELPVAEVFESGVSDADSDLRLTLLAALRHCRRAAAPSSCCGISRTRASSRSPATSAPRPRRSRA